MAHKSDGYKFGNRMSEEYQLLAEEKWIIETLNKLKHQRNCLQIERLHLESLKTKLKPGSNRGLQLPQEEPVASTSAINLMKNVKPGEQNETVEKHLDDEACNEEELNLVVTNPVFNRNRHTDLNMEEDDEEEIDDSDMYIDMNMLMNGEFQ